MKWQPDGHGIWVFTPGNWSRFSVMMMFHVRAHLPWGPNTLWKRPLCPRQSGARGQGALTLRLQCLVQDWKVCSGITQFSGIGTLILDNKLCLLCFWAGQTQWATCHCNPEFSERWCQVPAHAARISDSVRRGEAKECHFDRQNKTFILCLQKERQRNWFLKYLECQALTGFLTEVFCGQKSGIRPGFELQYRLLAVQPQIT